MCCILVRRPPSTTRCPCDESTGPTGTSNTCPQSCSRPPSCGSWTPTWIACLQNHHQHSNAANVGWHLTHECAPASHPHHDASGEPSTRPCHCLWLLCPTNRKTTRISGHDAPPLHAHRQRATCQHNQKCGAALRMRTHTLSEPDHEWNQNFHLRLFWPKEQIGFICAALIWDDIVGKSSLDLRPIKFNDQTWGGAYRRCNLHQSRNSIYTSFSLVEPTNLQAVRSEALANQFHKNPKHGERNNF